MLAASKTLKLSKQSTIDSHLFFKMIIRFTIIILVLLNSSDTIIAQSILKGKVYEGVTDSTLYAVNVLNTRTKQWSRSAADGSYSIVAEEGDKVIFSMSGFTPDTVMVSYSMLLTQYDPTLYIRVVSLKEVTVNGSYRTDSFARRNYYRKVYDSQPHFINRHGPENGVGISVSPLNFFSNDSKEKRELKKRLVKDEKEDFIDHSFPQELVEKLTNLHGDSLGLFMYMYRPSYFFCRRATRADMILYINDKMKEFRKPKKKK